MIQSFVPELIDAQLFFAVLLGDLMGVRAERTVHLTEISSLRVRENSFNCFFQMSNLLITRGFLSDFFTYICNHYFSFFVLFSSLSLPLLIFPTSVLILLFSFPLTCLSVWLTVCISISLLFFLPSHFCWNSMQVFYFLLFLSQFYSFVHFWILKSISILL